MNNIRLWILSPFMIVGCAAGIVYVVTRTAFDNGVANTHKWLDDLEHDK